MIWRRVVSPPIRVTATGRAPSPFTEPATPSSPGIFSTGRDSPVRNASFTDDAPSATDPSIGTCSPGRTSTRSPTTSCSTGTSSSEPSAVTRRAIAQFAYRTQDEHSARIREEQGGGHGNDEGVARERHGAIPEPLLEVVAEVQDRDRQRHADRKPVAAHLRGMPGGLGGTLALMRR